MRLYIWTIYRTWDVVVVAALARNLPRARALAREQVKARFSNAKDRDEALADIDGATQPEMIGPESGAWSLVYGE